MVSHICAKIFADVDFTHIAAATIAQVGLSVVWYGFLFSALFRFYLARDKGVTRVDKIIFRWGSAFCTCSTIASAIVKALVIAGLAGATGAATSCEFYTIAGIVAVLVTSMQHHAYWEQRPLPLLVIAAAYEFTAAALAALTLFNLKRSNIRFA